jgi:hypothetical protein
MSALCQQETLAVPHLNAQCGTWMPVEEPSTASQADIGQDILVDDLLIK